MTTAAHKDLAQAVVCEMKRKNDPATTSAIWPRVLEAIKTDPRPFARALGLLASEPRQRRTFH